MGVTVKAAWVWLTAVMTLVAGLPHFDCRCPNGQVKRFCLGRASPPSGCCCGGACCSSASGGRCCCRSGGAASARQAEKRSCCGRHTRLNDERPSAAGVKAQHTCCSKVLAQVQAFVPSPAKPAVDPDQAPAVLPPAADIVCTLVPRAHTRTPWHVHLLAPPTDLVTLLQHFLI